jgi:hypothetical protein
MARFRQTTVRLAVGLSGVAAFWVLGSMPLPPQGAAGALIAAGIACGLVVGLACRETPRLWIAPTIALASAVVGWAALGLPQPLFGAIGAAAAAAVAAGAALLARKWGAPVAAAIALVALLCIAVWAAGFVAGPLAGSPAQSRDYVYGAIPQPERYEFDGSTFLRTYWLMKHGTPYYEAFQQALIDHELLDATFPKSPFNYREPLLFEIWRVLPGSTGADVFRWFVVWSLLAMIAGFVLATRLVDPGVALLAPVLLMRFFAFFWWADRTWFALIESWAGVALVAAVAALLGRKWVWSVALLTLAIAIRELTVVAIPAWIVAWAFLRGERRRLWWLPVAAVVAPAAALGIHLALVPPLAPGGSGVATWTHGGLDRLAGALMFGWSRFPHDIAPIGIAVAVLAVLASAFAAPVWRRAAMLCAVAASLCFLTAFSGGPAWMDWGAAFSPLFAAMAPAVLSPLLPAQTR